MKFNLSVPPHAVTPWLRDAEFIGPVPPSILEGKKGLSQKDKDAGYEGVLLPDLVWGAGDRASIRRLQKLGVRTINYISFSIRPIPPPAPRKHPNTASEEEHRAMIRASFLAKKPELAIYDSRGVRQRCIFADQNSPYRIEICPNTRGVVGALEEEVRRMMRSGVDAVFIDHVFGVSPCHGERIGVHEHLYHQEDLRGVPEEHLRFAPGTDAPNDDPLSNFAYAMLLARMHKVIREYGDEKVLIGNTTFWPFKYSAKLKKYVLFSPVIHRRVPELFWRYLDCGMVESYLLVPRSFVSADSNDPVTVRWQTCSDWEREADIPERYRALGRRLVALPYAGQRSDLEDLFFAFVAARLDNMIWMGSDPRATGQFCKLRLGLPVGEKQRSGAILYRSFERGVLALNPTDRPAAASLPAAWPQVRDFLSGRPLPVERGRLPVKLPANAGRIFLDGDASPTASGR